MLLALWLLSGWRAQTSTRFTGLHDCSPRVCDERGNGIDVLSLPSDG
jgi:hypothetical protein